MTANYFTTGAPIQVHVEDGHWWALCPACPGWSAAADSWDELYRLVSEAHNLSDSPHRAWHMVSPIIASDLVTWTATLSDEAAP
jgi:hypothetical protein